VNIEEKKQVVESLKSRFIQSKAVLIAHYSGLNVKQLTNFRVLANDSNVSVKVAKNSLVKLATVDTEFTNLNNYLVGPAILICSDDVVALTKLVVNFSKDNDLLKIKVGSYNNSIIDADEIVKISKMLSLDEIRAKLISLIQAPASKVARVLQTPASNCVGVLKSYSKK
jgi:large subunit ribosomal protein L10